MQLAMFLKCFKYRRWIKLTLRVPWEKSQDRNRFMFSGDWIGMQIGAPERDGDCRPQQQYRKQKRMPKTVPVFGAN